MNNELEHITPQLHNLKVKKQGFSIPENYFNHLEEDCNIQLFLSDLPQKTGMKVPDNYFNAFEDNLLTELALQKSKKVKILKLIKIVSSVAAVFFISFGLGRYFMNLQKLSDNDFEQLTVYSTAQINDYELANIYEKELEQIEITDFITTDEIESYLQNDVENVIYYD